MAGVTTYSCTRCRPVDTEIIEAYQILTNTSKAVSQQEAVRVSAENARVAAENQRTLVFNQDHGTAVADHTTAVADHGTASSDHTLAVQDHEASVDATSRADSAATAAQHMVDIHQGPPGPAGVSPIVGENGNWFEWDDATQQYVDTGEKAQGEVGPTPAFAIGTVATGEAGSQASATITGTAAAPVLNLTIPKGDKGEQGNTGSSVAYPYELVNNRTTDDATKGLSAAEGKRLGDDITQLEHEVHNLSGKYYGVFADETDLPDDADTPGYAFVGADSPYAIWNFDGEDWSDSGSVANGITGEPGVGFSSIFTPVPYDGTMVIVLSNNDTITVDLNHTHDEYFSKLVGTAQPSGGFLPDVAYNLGEISGTVTFALAAAVTGQLNHYFWMFDTGGTAPTVTFPNGITWADGTGPTVAANKHYEISILGGIAYYSEV